MQVNSFIGSNSLLKDLKSYFPNFLGVFRGLAGLIRHFKGHIRPPNKSVGKFWAEISSKKTLVFNHGFSKF